jgi:hypothetical protein
MYSTSGGEASKHIFLGRPLTKASHQKGHIMVLLLKHGLWPKSDEILCHIAGRNDIASLQSLIKFGVEIAVYGHAALFTAILWGQRAMVEILTFAIRSRRAKVTAVIRLKGGDDVVLNAWHNTRIASSRSSVCLVRLYWCPSLGPRLCKCPAS